MKRSYYVAALWDADALVWYSESNIPGFVVEAASVAEFEQLIDELAPEMLAANEGIHNERVPVDFRLTRVRELAVV